MFDVEKAQSELRKENMHGEKDTSKGNVMSKEIGDEYIKTNLEGLKPVIKNRKVSHYLKTK